MCGMGFEGAVTEHRLIVEWTLAWGGCMLLHDGLDALPCMEELEKLPRCFDSL